MEDCKSVPLKKKNNNRRMEWTNCVSILKGAKQPGIKSGESSKYILDFENMKCLTGYHRN